MIKTNEDLEGTFRTLERHYELTGDGTYLVAATPHSPPVGVRLEPPVVVVQVKIGDAPRDDVAVEARLFRRLLELNSTDIVHASYCLDGDAIVLNAALDADTMDANTLEATLADIGLALTEHVPVLRGLVAPSAP